jgi:ribosomal-protein-alanine N-acetyltransferase
VSVLAPFPVIDTPRLRLRELTETDADALYAILGDVEVMRWWGSDPVQDSAAALALIRTFACWRVLAHHPGLRWGIERRSDRSLIGTCGLFSWSQGWRYCVTGFELARAAQGHGYMHEALAAAFDWGFAQMDLNRIEAHIDPRNAPSLKLAARLGFVEEGRLREIALWGGAQHDLLMLSLLRRDWLIRRAS